MPRVGRSETKVVLRVEAAEVRGLEMTWRKKFERSGIVANVAEGTKQWLLEKSLGCAVVPSEPVAQRRRGWHENTSRCPHKSCCGSCSSRRDVLCQDGTPGAWSGCCCLHLAALLLSRELQPLCL